MDTVKHNAPAIGFSVLRIARKERKKERNLKWQNLGPTSK
jgi:hypothetical protein